MRLVLIFSLVSATKHFYPFKWLTAACNYSLWGWSASILKITHSHSNPVHLSHFPLSADNHICAHWINGKHLHTPFSFNNCTSAKARKPRSIVWTVVYEQWTVDLSLRCRQTGCSPLSCSLSVSRKLYDLTSFLIQNVSFKRAYRVHAPQLLPACPRGGRFSCFSLMEKAMAMKFPPTADPVTPRKRSALHNAVNRWGWRTGCNTDASLTSGRRKKPRSSLTALRNKSKDWDVCDSCHTSVLEQSVFYPFIQLQPGTHGQPALAEWVKVRHFSCRAALEEAGVTPTTQSTKRSLTLSKVTWSWGWLRLL